MYMKQIFLLVFLLISLNTKGQDLELIHNISSAQTYQVITEESENLTIYLDFYSPAIIDYKACLLYTSPSPRDGLLSRMPSSA